jgi:Protein of unknown function (DUF2950)
MPIASTNRLEHRRDLSRRIASRRGPRSATSAILLALAFGALMLVVIVRPSQADSSMSGANGVPATNAAPVANPAAGLSALPTAIAAPAPTQKIFSSAEEGAEALVAAIQSGDPVALRAVLGTGATELLDSGDPAADRRNQDAFLKAYQAAHTIVTTSDTQAELRVGVDQWPLPIPLVRTGEVWQFDAERGKQEVMLREIGRNELGAIQVCEALADAEREYATRDWDGDGVLEYAAKILSTPGQHNGLYWETHLGEPQSPVGSLLAAASVDRLPDAKPLSVGPRSPYRGYLYRILTRQGRNAPGGVKDYMVNGNMVGGFAALAYPAHYGVTGIQTFLVNTAGAVFQKDLGSDTQRIAQEMTEFNPDDTWTSAVVKKAEP